MNQIYTASNLDDPTNLTKSIKKYIILVAYEIKQVGNSPINKNYSSLIRRNNARDDTPQP